MDDTRPLPDRLHSWAIRLLRRLRETDRLSPVSAAELSALSVIVYRGPLSLGELADAEQVRPPSASRTVASLVERKLVERERSDEDRRVLRITATRAGRKVLEEGRQRRLESLRDALAGLGSRDRKLLEEAVSVLERLPPA
jgi:DNA-binding MarR family transcriptional regulator